MSNFAIIGEIQVMVDDLLDYDRRYDDDLPVGAIEEAIENGEITITDMVETFREALVEALCAKEFDLDD